MTETQENKSLKSGYLGESNRDASSKILGFVYQNFIAIEELIKKNTVRVFCEYVEDTTSIDENGNCRIIQAKYYSSKLPSSMECEVYREMYCQYLKMMEEGKMESIIPVLDVYSPGKKTISIPAKDVAETWLSNHKKHASITSLSELETKKLDKDEREAAIIDRYGTKQKHDAYHSAYKVNHRKDDLEKFRQQLVEQLDNLFEDEELDNTWLEGVASTGEIFLGMAYQMILETFNRRKPNHKVSTADAILAHKEIKRSDFKQKLLSSIEVTDESMIIKVVNVMISEIHLSIITQNKGLTEKQLEILEVIVENTKSWINELLSTIEGQYALINTVSLQNSSRTEKFKTKTLTKREHDILMNYRGIKSLMKYLWKIMMNICMSKKDFSLDTDKKLLDPRTYIVKKEKTYICFKFEKDFVRSSIILPSVNPDEGREQRHNVYERMYSIKPEKWFMGGDHKKAGKYEYSFSPADITDIEQTVTEVKNDSDIFYLECMECIGIDIGNWMTNEDCRRSHVLNMNSEKPYRAQYAASGGKEVINNAGSENRK